MKEDIKGFIGENKEFMFKTLKELCRIPAPSHKEEKRAEYCKSMLESMGAKGVYIDEALNVIFPLGCDESEKITVFAAHTDTVFSDAEPMPCNDDGERVYCPGAADDTASVTVLLMTAKYFVENNIRPENGIMFVFNSCEEGLGNLKGTRQLFKDFDGRISQFVTFDSNIDVLNDRCVGSRRYEVEVLTEGGHSYEEFGSVNAIARLSEIISSIYKISVPEKSGTKTTYNVGMISGGTSVNTIAQSAKMLCEFRSDDYDSMQIMQRKFEKIFDDAKADGVQLKINVVGDRPCGNVQQEKIDDIKKVAAETIEKVTGEKVKFRSASTDCNIPLSLGIPAICMGVNRHGGIHTREEWVDKESLAEGLEIAIETALRLMGKE